MPAHLRAARLRTRRLPNVRFEHGDLHEVPHPAGSLRCVYSVEGFCYMRNSIVGALDAQFLTSAYGYDAVTLSRASTP